jgi:hypothetical protein
MQIVDLFYKTNFYLVEYNINTISVTGREGKISVQNACNTILVFYCYSLTFRSNLNEPLCVWLLIDRIKLVFFVDILLAKRAYKSICGRYF